MNCRKMNNRMECYATLTRLSAEAMRRGDRVTAAGYATA